MRPLWASVVTDHRRTPPTPQLQCSACGPGTCGYWYSVLLAAVGLLVRSSSTIWLCSTFQKVLDEQARPLDAKPVGRRQASHPAERPHSPPSSGFLLTLLPPALPSLFPVRPGSHSAVRMQAALPGVGVPLLEISVGLIPDGHQIAPVGAAVPAPHGQDLFHFPSEGSCLGLPSCENCIVLLYSGTSLDLAKLL